MRRQAESRRDTSTTFMSLTHFSVTRWNDTKASKLTTPTVEHQFWTLLSPGRTRQEVNNRCVSIFIRCRADGNPPRISRFCQDYIPCHRHLDCALWRQRTSHCHQCGVAEQTTQTPRNCKRRRFGDHNQIIRSDQLTPRNCGQRMHFGNHGLVNTLNQLHQV